MKKMLVRLLVALPLLCVSAMCVADKVLPPTPNTVPEISNSSKVPSKVFPTAGISGEEFTFGLEYHDGDGEPCSPCQLWVDLDQDGKFGENEKFDMTLIDSKDEAIPKEAWANQDWKTWQRFTLKMKITSMTLNDKFSFRFYFPDGKDEPVNTSDYVAVQTVVVRPIIVVKAEQSSYEAVPGSQLRVTILLYLQQQSTKQLVFQFAPVDAMTLPKGLRLRERKVWTHRANRDYDVAELTLYYDVSSDMSVGTHRLQFPKMSYEKTTPSADPKVSPQKKLESFQIPDIALAIVPIRISGLVVDAQALTLGSPFDYNFTVSLGANFKDKDLLVSTLRAQTFLPFRLINRDVVVTEVAGHSTEIAVHYALALENGAPGAYQVPGFSFGGLSLPPLPITMFPIEPPGKPPENQPDFLALLERIKTLSTPIVPTAASLSRTSPMYLIGGGTTTLALLALLWGQMRLKRRRALALLAEEVATQNAFSSEFANAKSTYERTGTKADAQKAFHALRAYLIYMHKRGGAESVPDGVLAGDLAGVLGVESDALFDELVAWEERYFQTF